MMGQSQGGNGLIGARIGHYEVIGRLGAGGMAELFLARATGLEGFEKLVALKRIRPEFADDDELARMFLEEARLAAKLQHPNIAQVFDIGAFGSQHFFTMEYIEGEDLRTVQRSAGLGRRQLPLKHALVVGWYVAAALHHAHTKRDSDGCPLAIVHRDVSPSNVLISYDGIVKLVDFGIAKASTSGVVTRSGALRGKLVYMSPEQCAGHDVDARSDVFSLGLVLYELISGARPFELDNEVAIAQRLLSEDVPLPSARSAGIPADVEAVLMRALARDRRARYPTAQHLQLDLERLLVDRRVVPSSVALGCYMQGLFADRIDERRSSLIALAPRCVNDPLGSWTARTVDAVDIEQPTSVMPRSASPTPPMRGGRIRALLAVLAAGIGTLIWVVMAQLGTSNVAPPAQRVVGTIDAVLAEVPAAQQLELPAADASTAPEASAQPSGEAVRAEPTASASPPPRVRRGHVPQPKPAPKIAPADMDAPFPGGSWAPSGAGR